MDYFKILPEWGWAAVFMIFVIDKVWPFLTVKVFPSFRKSELDEKKWQRLMDERRIISMENLGASVERAMKEMSRVLEENGRQTSTALTIQNERIANLIASHEGHISDMNKAVGDMRESVAVINSRK